MKKFSMSLLLTVILMSGFTSQNAKADDDAGLFVGMITSGLLVAPEIAGPFLGLVLTTSALSRWQSQEIVELQNDVHMYNATGEKTQVLNHVLGELMQQANLSEDEALEHILSIQ